MSGSSLDKLENRVRTAVQEAKTMRVENARLQAYLRELTAERDTLKSRAGGVGRLSQGGNGPVDLAAVRERLKAVLRRLDQIEQHLEALESQ